MANPFSFSQAVFFKRETPINQEGRILDFVARHVIAPRNMHMTLFIFVHYAHVVYGGTYNIRPRGVARIWKEGRQRNLRS